MRVVPYGSLAGGTHSGDQLGGNCIVSQISILIELVATGLLSTRFVYITTIDILVLSNS